MNADRRDGQLGQLWQQAFGDSAETVDAFFRTGFSPQRCHYLCADEEIVSALYWFDCALNGQKIAYIYAVATLKSHRGKGFAHALMEQTHEILKKQGYAGAILVPGAPELAAFYEKMGYVSITTVGEFSCACASSPVALRQVEEAEYADLRKALLPPDSVIQEGAALAYLHTYCKFYAGEHFVLAAAVDGDTLNIQEYLGDAALAGGILSALGVPEGRFRTPGSDRNFAMLLPFIENCPKPTYFGLALD